MKRSFRHPVLVGFCFSLLLAGPAHDRLAEATEKLGPVTRTFQFSYSVSVRDIPEGATHVALWVPVPKTDRHQTIRDLKVETSLPYRIEREPQYGNSVLHVETKAPLPSEVNLDFHVVVERQAYSVLEQRDHGEIDSKPTQRDLQPDRLVPLDGRVGELAAEVARDSETQLETVRALYDYVTKELSYDKSGKGWGQGDAVYACDVRKGNCTDFHSLLIGMARARGIPARFVMGFPLPENTSEGEIPGYHCWAELYVEDIGWLPMDSSEASKHPEKYEAFFGGLDANRVEFTTGRDLELVPEASSPLNYFVYPYVEVDGKQHNVVKRQFSFSEVGS